MSALVAGSVTYTLQNNAVKGESGRRIQMVKIAFGDSALTYPTGGVPLSGLSSWGWPNLIESVLISDEGKASGYVFKYDFVNNKLLMYVRGGFTPAGTVAAPVFTGSALAAHGHVLHLKNADQADAAGNRVNAAAGKLGANTGADIDLAAVANVSGSGGIVSITAGTPAGTNEAPAFTGTAVAAAALIELASSVAPAAQTLYAMVSGY